MGSAAIPRSIWLRRPPSPPPRSKAKSPTRGHTYEQGTSLEIRGQRQHRRHLRREIHLPAAEARGDGETRLRGPRPRIRQERQAGRRHRRREELRLRELAGAGGGLPALRPASRPSWPNRSPGSISATRSTSAWPSCSPRTRRTRSKRATRSRSISPGGRILSGGRVFTFLPAAGIGPGHRRGRRPDRMDEKEAGR